MKLSSERVDPERIGPCGQEMARLAQSRGPPRRPFRSKPARFEGRTPTQEEARHHRSGGCPGPHGRGCGRDAEPGLRRRSSGRRRSIRVHPAGWAERHVVRPRPARAQRHHRVAFAPSPRLRPREAGSRGDHREGDCTRNVYRPGEIFVETPGHVHKALNVEEDGVVLVATFVGLPPDTPPTTDEANPAWPEAPIRSWVVRAMSPPGVPVPVGSLLSPLSIADDEAAQVGLS